MQLIKLGKPLVHYLRTCKIALQCLSHELIIAKLNAYGFILPALKLTRNFLSKKSSKELRLIILTVLGLKSSLAYHKIQYNTYFTWHLLE